MGLKRKVRVRVSVVPNNFMIPLTFVRNSNGSHGIVGRTTWVWSGRSGFENQPLPTFLKLIIQMENHDIAPLLVCMKRFDTRVFLKPRRVPLWNFSVLWDKKYPSENSDTPSSLPVPPLIHKVFRSQKFSEAQKGSSMKFFVSVQWDKKSSTEKRDNPPPPLMDEIFWYPKFSETQKSSTTMFFVLVRWDKKNRRKNVIYPSYAWNFSIPEFFWNIEGFPTKFFGIVRQKKFNEKMWYLLFCIKYRNQWWNWCL